MGAVRRPISIALLAVVMLPFLAPILAWGSADDARLPACCRRSGHHHCAGTPATANDGHHHLGAPSRCASFPRALTAMHPIALDAPPAATRASFALSALPQLARTLCLRRFTHDRSRQKRGPPLA
jgi:hypothetical protein